MTWVGIDVGAPRKGFHAAALGPALEVELREFRGDDQLDRIAGWIGSVTPEVVAVDSPAAWAAPGLQARRCEVAFAQARICGIRFTPDAATAAARTDGYYGWIEHGLALWSRLGELGVAVVECFPTASWTQWHGPRDGTSRARWTRRALASLTDRGLSGTEAATNQDRRDAVAAALTARQWTRNEMLAFGPLVVPPAGSDPLA